MRDFIHRAAARSAATRCRRWKAVATCLGGNLLAAIIAISLSQSPLRADDDNIPPPYSAPSPAIHPVVPVITIPAAKGNDEAPTAGASATASDSDSPPVVNTKPSSRRPAERATSLADPSLVVPDATADGSSRRQPATDVPHSSTAPSAAAGAVEPPSTGEPFTTLSALPRFPNLRIEQATFKGIRPGTTSREELLKKWGQPTPSHRKDGTVEWLYTVTPYPKVCIQLTGTTVSAVIAEFDKPADLDAMIGRLRLDAERGVPVLDEAGQTVGESFPEQGLLLSFASGTRQVTQMMLEPIDPEPFLVRAALRAEMHPGLSLQDLDYALQLDANSARGYDLRAQILLKVGRTDEALQAADQALRIDPQNPAYLLSRAEILGNLGRQTEAAKIVDDLLARADLPPLLKAQALCQSGDLTIAGPTHDHKQALALHLQAIQTGEPLISDNRPGIRRQAKRVLLDAHLGAANDIAWGVWQQKSQIVPKWIEQADELARDLVEHEEANPSLRLKVARAALFAAVGMRGGWDAAEWLELARDAGRKSLETTDDPLRRRRIQWELGLALANALAIDPARHLSESTLPDALQALDNLEQGAKYRQPTPDDVYLLGRLYFQIGVVHAVAKQDHKTAVTWFDRARPLLDRPLPPAVVARPGKHGESLVSMGISYWETGRRELGLQLTQQGLELMVKAVNAGQLDRQALSAPYGNLATMHRELNHPDQARAFAELASQSDPKRR